MFYPKLSCLLALLLSVLPLFFHLWYQQSPVSPSNTSQNHASVIYGPFFEMEALRFKFWNSRSPLDTPGTLVLFLYQWIADFVMHVFFATSESLIDRAFWLQFINLYVCFFCHLSLMIILYSSRDNLVIALGIWLRLNIYIVVFFLLCVAERSFQQVRNRRILHPSYLKFNHTGVTDKAMDSIFGTRLCHIYVMWYLVHNIPAFLNRHWHVPHRRPL